MATAPNKAAAKRTRKPAASKSTVPANVRKPADHQPAKEDVEGPKSLTVEWHGHEYTIAGEDLDDVEVLEHITDDNFIGALRLMLGPEGWAQYKENERDPKTGKTTASGAGDFFYHVLDKANRKN